MDFFRSVSLDPVTEEGEEWFSIHPDIQEYQFSNHGRLKSFKWGKEKILKFHLNNDGYLYSYIRVNKKNIAIGKHQCVCLALKNPYEKYCYDLEYILKNYDVNHIDGDRTNNHPSNLELVPSIENYCICKNKKRKNEMLDNIEIYKLAWGSDLTNKEIANLYDVSHSHICNIKADRCCLYSTSEIDPKNIKQWEIELILKKFNKIEINEFQEADLNDFF